MNLQKKNISKTFRLIILFSGLIPSLVPMISCSRNDLFSNGIDDKLSLLPRLIAPVLTGLTISATDAASITLAQPAFSDAGSPQPGVETYIGLDGTISASGPVVSNYQQGPFDVSSGPQVFSGLSANTMYRIYVVAQNVAGYSVMQIAQSTAPIGPAMNPLVLSAFDSVSMTLAQPNFSIAGNPLPTVLAYIGPDATFSVSGTTLIGVPTEGPVNVSSGPYVFSGLAANTPYRIIVISQNIAGNSVKQIVQSTGLIAPVLNPLVVPSFTPVAIDLKQPTFATMGNPAPTVEAYLGLDGTISAAGAVVSGFTQGPYDLSASAISFGGLSSGTAYRIIVVAQNGSGYSVEQIMQVTP